MNETLVQTDTKVMFECLLTSMQIDVTSYLRDQKNERNIKEMFVEKYIRSSIVQDYWSFVLTGMIVMSMTYLKPCFYY